jgi:hypothetical protein
VAVPSASEQRRWFLRACERRRSRGQAAMVHRGGRPASTLLCRGGGASTDGAPKPDERWRRTLGPVVTAVARDAVGFGSSGGRSWRSAHDGGSQSGARWRPPPVTTTAFPRREWRRRTSLGGEWSTTMFLCYFVYICMPTFIGFMTHCQFMALLPSFVYLWYFYSHFM